MKAFGRGSKVHIPCRKESCFHQVNATIAVIPQKPKSADVHTTVFKTPYPDLPPPFGEDQNRGGVRRRITKLPSRHKGVIEDSGVVRDAHPCGVGQELECALG